MLHVNLGRTGLQVSRLCLGTMTFGIQCDEATSFAIIDAAAEAGITFFDTADVYPLGGRRDEVGRPRRSSGAGSTGGATSSSSPPSASVATGPAPWDRGSSRKHILDAVEGSLRRLGTDYIDLYQLHCWRRPTRRSTRRSRALDDLVRSGKVRYVGCSNFLAYQLARAIGRSEVLRPGPLRLACSLATTSCSARSSASCSRCATRRASA